MTIPTRLIRFHDWIIDANQIQSVIIKTDHPEKVEHEYSPVIHSVIVDLKSDNKFTLLCPNLYDARKHLNHLTINLNAEYRGEPYDHYIIKQLIILRSSMRDLESEVNKIIKKFSTAQKKLKTIQKEKSHACNTE